MVVKIAGALLDDPEAVRSLARQIAQVAQQGMSCWWCTAVARFYRHA